MEQWIIPCSPNIYNAEEAFKEYGTIVWHQDCNIQPGDVVYIYVTAPVKELRCKCIAVDVDIPFDIGEDEGYTIDEEFCSRSYRRYMSLKLVELYDNTFLSFKEMLHNGLGGTVRSQRRINPLLQKYIEDVTRGSNHTDN